MQLVHFMRNRRGLGGRRPYRPTVALLALGLGMFGAAPVWAASVDLYTQVSAPSQGTLFTPFQYTVTVGSVNTSSGTAQNSTLLIPLPPNVYNVSVAGLSSTGGATCPTTFSNVPTGTSSAATPAVTAVVPALPAGATCTFTVTATPAAQGSFTIKADVTAGAGDTELLPSTNPSVTNMTVPQLPITVGVKKSIVSGATPSSSSGAVSYWNAESYTNGTRSITYRVTYTNESDVDLPVARLNSSTGITDWEQVPAGRVAPAAATTTGVSCTATGSSVCPVLRTSNGLPTAPWSADVTHAVVGARSNFTIQYTRTYTAPVCGAAQIQDGASWTLDATMLRPTWRAGEGPNSSTVFVDFPQATPCNLVNIAPKIAKTLVGVRDAAGTLRTAAPLQINADGDTAIYDAVITGDAVTALNVALRDEFSTSELPWGIAPTFWPTQSVSQRFRIASCTDNATPAGSYCSRIANTSPYRGTYPRTATDYTASSFGVVVAESNPAVAPTMNLPANAQLTLRFEVDYRFNNGGPRCVSTAATMVNRITMYTYPPAGTIYTGANTVSSNNTARLWMLPNLPRCADVQAAKSTTPQGDASPGDTRTFTLTYTNGTKAATGNGYTSAAPNAVNPIGPLTNVRVTDALGPNFHASSASCTVKAGSTPATVAPAGVSVAASIDPATNVFSAIIPSLADATTDAVVCTISGTVSLPGTYTNSTTVRLDPADTARMDINTSYVDANGTTVQRGTDNDTARINYGVLGSRVGLTKTVTPGPAVAAGSALTYTVTATNHTNTSTATNVLVQDTPPLAQYSWTCASTGGACPQASSGAGGSGGAPINATITLPPRATMTWTITGTLPAGVTAATNTATAALPPGVSCYDPADPSAPPTSTCTASASVYVPSIAVTKRSSVAGALTPGGTVVYTVQVHNDGGAPLSGVQVNDAMPAGIVSQSWDCAGAACAAPRGSGAIAQTLGTLAAGDVVTYTITATVSGNPPAQVVNTAVLTPPNGVPCTANGVVGACQASAANPPGPQVSVTKASSVTGALTPSGQVTYTVTVTNNSTVPATGVQVNDPVPAGIASQSWSCAGAACASANGTGAIVQTLGTLQPQAAAVYTINATVAGNPPAQVTNVATLVPPAGVLCAVNGVAASCSASASNPPGAQVSIQKTSSVAGSLTPGGTVTYTVTVTNTSNVTASGVQVNDPIPAGIASQSWSCAGAACAAATGTGGIAQTLGLLAPGATAVFTIEATVSTTPPAQVTNTATLVPPSGVQCSVGGVAGDCSASVSNPPGPQVSVTKTSSVVGALTPGGQVTYTVTVSNTGSVAATGIAVNDPMADGIASQRWTCEGAACQVATGTGGIAEHLGSLAVGATAVFKIEATVAGNPPARVTNTATLVPPSGAQCSVNGAAVPCTASVSNPPAAQVAISKTTANQPADVRPGATLSYTVTVSNPSAVAADGTVVSDPLADGVESQSWTCTANGTTCPADNGSGALSQTLTSLPARASLSYVVTAKLKSQSLPQQIVNTATVTPPTGASCAGGQCSASASLAVPVQGTVQPVPVNAGWLLVLLGAMLAGMGAAARQRR